MKLCYTVDLFQTKKDSPAKKAASTPTPAAKSTPAAKKGAAKDKKDEEVAEDTKEDALEEEQEPMDTSTAAAPESEEVTTHQLRGPLHIVRTYSDSDKNRLLQEEPAATEKESEPEKKAKSVDPEPPKDEVSETVLCIF